MTSCVSDLLQNALQKRSMSFIVQLSEDGAKTASQPDALLEPAHHLQW